MDGNMTVYMAIAGIFVGLFGSLIGLYFSSKRVCGAIMRRGDLADGQKLSALFLYFRALFWGASLILLFMALLSVLVFARLSHAIGNFEYMPLMLLLAGGFFAVYSFVFRRYRK